jgi:hypothetical protein
MRVFSVYKSLENPFSQMKDGITKSEVYGVCCIAWVQGFCKLANFPSVKDFGFVNSRGLQTSTDNLLLTSSV